MDQPPGLILDLSNPWLAELSRRAITSSVASTLINGLVLIPASWLWRRGTLELPDPVVHPIVHRFNDRAFLVHRDEIAANGDATSFLADVVRS